MATPLLNKKSIEYLPQGGAARLLSAVVINDEFFDEQNHKNYKNYLNLKGLYGNNCNLLKKSIQTCQLFKIDVSMTTY